MEIGTTIIKFKDYVNSPSGPDFDENLPFGGIRKDAPPEIKKIYEEYLEKDREDTRLGIRA